MFGPRKCGFATFCAEDNPKSAAPIQPSATRLDDAEAFDPQVTPPDPRWLELCSRAQKTSLKTTDVGPGT